MRDGARISQDPKAYPKGENVTKMVRTPGLIVLLSASCLASVASAQARWWRTYGGASDDGGYSVHQTTDGGYVIAGSTQSFGAGSCDVYLIRTDSAGDTLWTRAYGGAVDDVGSSVQQTDDSGFAVAGRTYSFGAGYSDVYLIRTSASGDTLWTRTYGGQWHDDGLSIQRIADGGYIISGASESYGAGRGDVYLIRTNVSGDTLWTRTYGDTNVDVGESVQESTDGGYIITGYNGTFGPINGDVYLIKTDDHGDTVWTRTYGGRVPPDWGYAVHPTANGGCISVGYTMSFGAGNEDVYLIKANASGDVLWTRTCGGPGRDIGYSVQQTIDGGYIIAGTTASFGAGGYDVYLVKTNAQGDTVWTRTYGGTNSDGGNSVQQTTDGGYIIAGSTASFGAGGSDVYLIKTDSLGNVGLVEESREPQVSGRKPVATIVQSLSPGALAFDAAGRRVMTAKSGILFVRDRSTITKVVLRR
jgi:hypothetical protein